MSEIPFGTWVESEFERSLTKNTVARENYQAMLPEEQEQVHARARRARTSAELDAIVDSLAGWQIGHGPYQL